MDSLEPASHSAHVHSEANQGPLDSDRIVCNGCKLTLEGNGIASDSVVVSFGNSLWHVDCFRCAKCRNLVEHDTNLLLLSDGSPVCENCSYICSVCKQPISNEAIVTGEESYHADCFRCRSCSNRIEELIFAKTSQGIYCMACHNQRVTRSRRHAEAKRNKATSTHVSSKQKDRTKERDRERDGARDRERDKERVRERDGHRERERERDAHGDPNYLKSTSNPSHSSSAINLHPELSFEPGLYHQASPSVTNLASSSSCADPFLGRNAQQSSDPKLSAVSLLSSSHHPRSPSSADSVHNLQPSTSSDLGHRPLQSKQSVTHLLGFRRRGDSTSSLQPSSSNPLVALNTHPASVLLSSSSSSTTRPSTADGRPNQPVYPHPSPFPSSTAINRSYDSSPHLRALPDPLVPRGATSPQTSSNLLQSHKSKLLDIASDTPGFRSLLKHRSASLDSFSYISSQLSLPTSQSRLDLDSEVHRSAIVSATPSFPYNDIFSSLDHNPSPPLLSSSVLDAPRPSKIQYDDESLLPSYASSDLHDPLVISASCPAVDVSTSSKSNNIGERANGQSQDLSLEIGALEKLLLDLDETREKLKALRDEYHKVGSPAPSTLEGSDSFAAKRLSLKREDAELKMKELSMRMAQHTSRLKAIDSHRTLEHHPEQLEASVLGLQNHLRQLIVERDFTVTEIEELNSVRDQVKKDGTILQPVDQVLTAKFQQIRDQYISEIRELATERDQLKEEVTHLNKVRESQAKELDSLNQRFDSLSEMNAAAVKRLEETRILTSRTQGRSAAPSDVKVVLASPTTALNLSTNEPELSPEVNIATTRKFKWGKSHAQKASTNLKNNNHHTQNSVISSGVLADLVSTSSDITIAHSHSLGVNDGTSQTNNNHGLTNNTNSNLINNNSSSNLATLSHQPGSSNHTGGGSSGNNASVNSSSSPSTQPQPQPHQLSSNSNNSSNNPNSIANMRPHTFQPVSALRPVRCDYCGDKLWGLAEVRCTSCGSYCHTKCAGNFFGCQASPVGPINSTTTPLTSMGSTTTNISEEDVDSALFGNDLIHQAKLENKSVPSIVMKCIEAIERHGLKFEGIYRKTGGMSSVKMIQNCFEKGTNMNFNDLDKFNDISAITSTLKNYFRQLPNPLFTFELHEAFVTVATMGSEAIRLEALERVIYQLPLVHFETLKVLMTHLSNIEKLSEFNKMNSQNLGVIFGPTLLRSSNPARQFSDMPFTAKIVELTVLNKFQLFRKAYSSHVNTNSSTSNFNSLNTNQGLTNQRAQQSSSAITSSNLQSNSSGFSMNGLSNNLTINSLPNPTPMTITNFQSTNGTHNDHHQALKQSL